MANLITSTAAAVEDEKLQTITRAKDEHLKERTEYQNVDTLLPSNPWLGEDGKINNFNFNSLSQQPELPFRKPHINAKRRLDFQKVVDQADPVTLQPSSNGSVVADSELVNTFERKSIASKLTVSKDLHNGSLDFERESIASTLSCRSDSEINRVKTSGHICSTSTPSPGNSHTSSSPFSSTMAVSPLTKAFKAFHVHQPQLERQNSVHSQSSPNPSPSFLLPSYSYPCLFTAHPLSTHCQPFNLEPPPRGKESKATSSTCPSMCPEKISVTNSGTSFSEKTREQVNANVSHSGPVMTQGNRSTFASPTLGHTTLSSSVTSDSTTPSPHAQQSKPGNERTSSSLIRSMSTLHRHLSSSQTKATRTNGRNQQSSLMSGGRQKQPPMQTSTKPGQKDPRLSHRCPSKIHCTNCGHKIDLKAYIEKFEMTKDFPSGNTRKSNGKPAESVNNCGLTVYDLERICDTGCLDASSSISTDEKQQRIQQILCNEKSIVDRLSVDGNPLQFSNIMTAFPDTYYHPFHTPFFPHSDKVTRSFAPFLCDTAKEEFPQIEYWDKLDSLDVEEMLELLESAPNTKCSSACTKSQGDTAQRKVSLSVVSLREKGDAKLVEPVQPANHIVSEPVAVVSSDEIPYSTKSGETARVQHCECNPKRAPDKTSDVIDESSIGGHVSGCVDTGDSSEVSKRRVLRSRVKQHCQLRICKHKPRNNSRKTNKKKADH